MPEALLDPQLWLGALFVFGLRLVEMTLDTVRTLVLLRGRAGLNWVLGFAQSVIFVVATAAVLEGINEPLKLVGYAAGFATGVVVGMGLEERLAIGYTDLLVISGGRGSAVADRLRAEGYAITEIPGRGKDGMVTLLNCGVLRKNVGRVAAVVTEVDPEAFITAEDLRPLRHGFWRA
jgi:uncharacterized protein YebE (UPF0316 family)